MFPDRMSGPNRAQGLRQWEREAGGSEAGRKWRKRGWTEVFADELSNTGHSQKLARAREGFSLTASRNILAPLASELILPHQPHFSLLTSRIVHCDNKF